MKRTGALKTVIRACLPCAPLLMISYFLYAGITAYAARIVAQFVDAVMKLDGMRARSIQEELAVALLFAILAMPAFDLLTNVVTFRYGLRHDLRVVSAFYQKRYESAMRLPAGELVQRFFRDPLNLRMLALMTPARMLAQLSVAGLMIYLLFEIHTGLALATAALIAASAAGTALLGGRLAACAEEKSNLTTR